MGKKEKEKSYNKYQSHDKYQKVTFDGTSNTFKRYMYLTIKFSEM
jgi:hypothetical protein